VSPRGWGSPRNEAPPYNVNSIRVAPVCPLVSGREKKISSEPPGGKRPSLRKVAAELARQGYLKERGKPYAAKSIAAMVGSGR
jgi:hypothetical protein